MSLIGYCTNVHPGQDLATTRLQLDTHATKVRQLLDRPEMGVGLWLSRATASELLSQPQAADEFALWLRERGLRPYTLNGFPYGDFHGDVVKHAVYQPTWAEEERLEFTWDLARILPRLLAHFDSGPAIGTISTLPLGWPGPNDAETRRRSADHLRLLVERLVSLEEATGTRIDICLEPEPGCLLGDMPSLIDFFLQDLASVDSAQQERLRRHLSVCYDICHAGVMNESAQDNVAALKTAGIRIGKVQVSSALEVDFDPLSASQKNTALRRLIDFAEPRYLHQTVVYQRDRPPRFYEDLPLALADPEVQHQGRWTVHFHVPISHPQAGCLGTTQRLIPDLIQAVTVADWRPTHWEVETYAWNVLPPDLQEATLAAGIAREIQALENWLQLT